MTCVLCKISNEIKTASEPRTLLTFIHNEDKTVKYNIAQRSARPKETHFKQMYENHRLDFASISEKSVLYYFNQQRLPSLHISFQFHIFRVFFFSSLKNRLIVYTIIFHKMTTCFWLSLTIPLNGYTIPICLMWYFVSFFLLLFFFAVKQEIVQLLMDKT